MAKRRVRRDALPPAPGLHQYAEHAAEFVFRYKFTVIVALALVVGALGLTWMHWHRARGSEARAWETFGQSRRDELRRALPELQGTGAYPWASLQVAAGLYHQGRLADAHALLEPVALDPDLDPYPRGYCLYVLGCIYAEQGRTAQAKNCLKNALTVNEKSSFLQGLVTRQLVALDGWPPTDAGSEKAETEPADLTTGPDKETSGEESGAKP